MKWLEFLQAVREDVEEALTRNVRAPQPDVPWPVPEELERPGWVFRLVGDEHEVVEYYWPSVMGVRGEELPDRIEVEERHIGRWLELEVEPYQGGPVLPLAIGWSVDTRTIYVFHPELDPELKAVKVGW